MSAEVTEMPSVPRKNKGVYVELPPELVDRARAFADDRGESFKDVVAEAIRRHLAYPPPASVPAPLPDAAPPDPPPAKKLPRKR